MLGCAGATAGAIASLSHVIGRADSAVGQSVTLTPASDVVLVSGSAGWQCDGVPALSACTGARQPASHHARSGAAVASTTAIRISVARFNTLSIIPVASAYCFFCASRSLARSPDRMLLMA